MIDIACMKLIALSGKGATHLLTSWYAQRHELIDCLLYHSQAGSHPQMFTAQCNCLLVAGHIASLHALNHAHACVDVMHEGLQKL